MLMTRLLLFVFTLSFSILLADCNCNCGGGHNGLRVKPRLAALRGGCSGLDISEEFCVVEAVEAGYEVQVKMYRQGNIKVYDLDLELLDSKDRPLNGWASFQAESIDIDMLNRTGEAYVSFRATDPTFLATLIEDFLDDEERSVRPGAISDTKKLAKKLRQSGAKHFAIAVRCQ